MDALVLPQAEPAQEPGQLGPLALLLLSGQKVQGPQVFSQPCFQGVFQAPISMERGDASQRPASRREKG